MIDLRLFFLPIDSKIIDNEYSNNTFHKNIHVNEGVLPNINNADIAIIGIKECSNNTRGKETKKGVDEVRKKLYSLKKGFGAYKIVDLGDISPGIDYQETLLRIKEVCHSLINNNVLPILIGGTHDIGYAQYMSYEDTEKLITLLNIDATIDLEDNKKDTSKNGFVNKVLLHEPNFLFNYIHLAYQSYLTDPLSITMLEKLYFEAYRIGQIRENIHNIEPVVRHADMLCFDISAIKSNDAPANPKGYPFGLTGEEACQICWYAGLNEKLSSIGFYEYASEKDDTNKRTASIIATMIWYFIEGFYHRKKEGNIQTNDYIKYMVSMPSQPEHITFYKSKLSEKWWIEVPITHGIFGRNHIVPCSYHDYKMAMEGELPLRWINIQARLA